MTALLLGGFGVTCISLGAVALVFSARAARESGLSLA